LPRRYRADLPQAVAVLVSILLAILCAALPEAPVNAQTITIGGAIPCAGSIQSAGSTPSSAQTIAIPLSGRAGGRAVLRIALRTNCAYDVSARWLGPAGSMVRLEDGAVSPADGGARLARHALNAFLTRAEAGRGRSAVWVTGPVISRGGNDTTPDNAIRVDLIVSLSPAASAGSLVLELNPRP
jgi:hypothetical protein